MNLKEIILNKKTLSEQIKELEIAAEIGKKCRCGEVRATLIVNYGSKGRCVKDLIDNDEELIQMLVKVLTYYVELKEPNNE